MRIAEIRAYKVFPRWVFVEVITDTDLIGYGEASLEGRANTVISAVEELKRVLIGKDPFRIEHLWQLMYKSSFYRGGPVLSSAISGVDIALWDLKGKILNAPVYELLGGPSRERVRLYAHIEPFTAGGYVKSKDSEGLELGTTSEYIEFALERKEQGFSAVKLVPVYSPRPLDHVDAVRGTLEKVKAVRDALGDKVDIAIDIHGRVLPAVAAALVEELATYGVLFVEEPCPPEDIQSLAAIRQRAKIPIAAGERLTSKWEALRLLTTNAVDILQPDLCHAGGVTECKKIAALAEAYDVVMAPHCPLGPIALAACLHLDAAIPNFLIQEFITLGENYLLNPFEVSQGYVHIPQGPGLGIELDEGYVKEMRAKAIDWDNTIWYYEDGAVAAW